MIDICIIKLVVIQYKASFFVCWSCFTLAIWIWEHIIESGQTFRWNKTPSWHYLHCFKDFSLDIGVVVGFVITTKEIRQGRKRLIIQRNDQMLVFDLKHIIQVHKKPMSCWVPTSRRSLFWIVLRLCYWSCWRLPKEVRPVSAKSRGHSDKLARLAFSSFRVKAHSSY